MPLSNSQPSRPIKLIKTKEETERRGLSDIQTLRKLLGTKNRKDLSILLENCTSYVEESSQFGSHLYSVISTFWIYVPPEKIEKAEQIPQQDKELLLELIIKIYPPKEHSPEITKLRFRVKTEMIPRENKGLDVMKPKITQRKTKEKWYQKWLRQIIIGIIIMVIGSIILSLIL